MLTAMFDAPTRVKVTLEDGTTREFVALAVEVVGVVTAKTKQIAAKQPTARAPSANAGKPPPEPTGSTEPIAVKPTTPIDGEVARAWLRGEFDALTPSPTTLGALLAVVGFLRRQMFKLDVATMSTNDAKTVRKAWQDGAKPSSFCRAVIGASRDPFWMDAGDITIMSLVKNLGRLSRSGATK